MQTNNKNQIRCRDLRELAYGILTALDNPDCVLGTTAQRARQQAGLIAEEIADEATANSVIGPAANTPQEFAR